MQADITQKKSDVPVARFLGRTPINYYVANPICKWLCLCTVPPDPSGFRGGFSVQ